MDMMAKDLSILLDVWKDISSSVTRTPESFQAQINSTVNTKTATCKLLI
jgi:hypothetical protein